MLAAVATATRDQSQPTTKTKAMCTSVQCKGVVIQVAMPEWLRGLTRNQMGFPRAGSNPAGDDSFLK